MQTNSYNSENEHSGDTVTTTPKEGQHFAGDLHHDSSIYLTRAQAAV